MSDTVIKTTFSLDRETFNIVKKKKNRSAWIRAVIRAHSDLSVKDEVKRGRPRGNLSEAALESARKIDSKANRVYNKPFYEIDRETEREWERLTS